MSQQDYLLAKMRRGEAITPTDTVSTITSLLELDEYRTGLSKRGALTSDAMAAIRDRQDALRRGKP